MTRKTLANLLILLCLSLPAAACGVKPDSVEAPEGSENVVYPRTYPTSLEE